MEADKKNEIINDDAINVTPLNIAEMISALRENQFRSEGTGPLKKTISETELRKKYSV